MPHILHKLKIEARANALRQATATADGLAAFWTDQTEANARRLLCADRRGKPVQKPA